MVFNSLQPIPIPNRLTMRGIASALLSLAHSGYRSLGNWFTTIKTMLLLSAAFRILIELIDWLSAVRGACPVPTTREAQPFENSEVAGASRVSPRSNPDSLSASWTAQPARCLVPQPYSPQEVWLLVRHSRMPVGVEASAAVSTNFSTRALLFPRPSCQTAA